MCAEVKATSNESMDRARREVTTARMTNYFVLGAILLPSEA